MSCRVSLLVRGRDNRPGTDRQDKAMSADHDHPCDADPVGGSPLVTLVMRARNGDEHAWAALVERYAPLIWSICREYRLGDSDAAGAGQHVWLHLAGQLDKIRDPAALPGWLAAATRRECERIRRPGPATHTTGHASEVSGDQPGEAGQLLTADYHAELRQALAHLSPCCQRLLTLLTEDPPVPYAKISAELGIPVGSIGPARRRCLDKLRRQPAIAALIDSATQTA
jgi:RNA polymerase sigma factor (sigma-70 family)